mmetsp:Transcript_2467/g.6207  ORF Transcript_2467/g.6207 Transcript_2467/m.6207 type:complete len:200 (+) Transcript_2467:172-771(+)
MLMQVVHQIQAAFPNLQTAFVHTRLHDRGKFLLGIIIISTIGLLLRCGKTGHAQIHPPKNVLWCLWLGSCCFGCRFSCSIVDCCCRRRRPREGNFLALQFLPAPLLQQVRQFRLGNPTKGFWYCCCCFGCWILLLVGGRWTMIVTTRLGLVVSFVAGKEIKGKRRHDTGTCRRQSNAISSGRLSEPTTATTTLGFGRIA